MRPPLCPSQAVQPPASPPARALTCEEPHSDLETEGRRRCLPLGSSCSMREKLLSCVTWSSSRARGKLPCASLSWPCLLLLLVHLKIQCRWQPYSECVAGHIQTRDPVAPKVRQSLLRKTTWRPFGGNHECRKRQKQMNTHRNWGHSQPWLLDLHHGCMCVMLLEVKTGIGSL